MLLPLFFFFPFSPYGCVEAEGILRLLILSLPVLSLGFEAIIRTAGVPEVPACLLRGWG